MNNIMVGSCAQKRLGWLVLALAIAMIGGGCDKQEASTDTPRSGKPVVVTTFYPTKYFCQRIGGDHLEVVCPVPDDEDAIYWMPDTEAIQVYQQADVIVLNGAGFAKWVQKVSLPEGRVIDTAKPLKDDLITFQHATVHSHGKSGQHAHEGVDGHTWVDPVNAKIQANEIYQALVKRYPEHETAFEQGFTAMAKDLDALDAKLKEYQAAYKDQPLLASHPAYNYLARRYGWNIKNLDLDPEKMPSDEVIQSIRELLKKHPAKFLLWEASPTKEITDRLQRDLGLTSIEFSPCELLSEQDRQKGLDYIQIMRNNLDHVSSALSD